MSHFLTYRSSLNPTTPSSTTVKGSPLTNLEVDGNFKALSNAIDALEGAMANTTYDLTAATTTGGANLSLVGSNSTTDTIKFASGSGISVGYSSNIITISSTVTDTNATYTIGTEAAAGGSLVKLTAGGSGGTNSQISIVGSGGTTVSQAAGVITISSTTGGGGSGVTYTQAVVTPSGGTNSTNGQFLTLSGSDASTDNVKFTGAGGTTVTRASADEFTITSTYPTYTLGTSTVSLGAKIALTAGGTGGTSTDVTILGSGGTTVTRDSGTGVITISSASGGGGTYTAGTGLTLVGSEFQHANTSNMIDQPVVDRTYIAALSFDTFGHVTGYSTATETVVDTNTTYNIAAVAATGGATFRLNGVSPTSTDDIFFQAGTGMTISRIDASTIKFDSTGSGSDTNSYPTQLTFTAGTTAGPVINLPANVTNGFPAVTSAAFPSASGSASGVVNTTSQTFAGAKTFSALLTASSNLSVTGTITASSTISSTGGDVIAFSGSDSRLKENIVPIDNALEKLEQINGVMFDWKEGYEFDRKHDVGVIAQEVEAVLPEVVATRPSGYKAVRYDHMIPLLIEAIKELSARVKELENR